MQSSRAATTCTLLSRGVQYKLGSVEDGLARVAVERERRIEYLKTVTLVNAIIGVGNVVAAAVTGSPNNQLGGDKVTKSLELLRDILLPEDSEGREKQATSAREKLAKEMAKGPLKVRAAGNPSKTRRTKKK